MPDPQKHLPRLPATFYRGQAYVHWTMTINERKQGWLKPVFLYRFREFLTHTMFRYAITCPIYCLMPDHMHLLWIGIDDQADQLKACKFFRKHVNETLNQLGFLLQHQPHDRVLRDEERKSESVEDLVEYIARNPERSGLIAVDEYAGYPYTGCLVPGYPEIRLWEGDYWARFWRSYSFLRKNGLFRSAHEDVL